MLAYPVVDSAERPADSYPALVEVHQVQKVALLLFEQGQTRELLGILAKVANRQGLKQ